MQNQQPMNYQDDEIDLFELWNNLWEQKILIIAITAVITILGGLVAFVKTPVYKSSAHFLPPQKQDIQAINISLNSMFDKQDSSTNTASQTMQTFTTAQIYRQFLTNMQSRSLRFNFFEQQNLLAFYSSDPDALSYKVFDKEFNQALKVSLPKKGQDGDFVSASFEITDPVRSAILLNEFVQMVQVVTKQQILDEINFEVATKVKELVEQIEAKRQLAQQRRLDRVAELEEALVIAKSIGLDNPRIDQAANNLNMEYMRGTKAIEAELSVLKNRKTDDPFIAGLRDLQEQVEYLKSIKIDPELVSVVRVDQSAQVPTSPIKPNKKLIVAVALVLGGMLGVFIALIRSAIRKRKLQTA